MKRLTIAMDGPGSAGKGTVARGVAQELAYQYVDTGAMYRSVALLARREDVAWSDAPGLAALAASIQFAFPFEHGTLRVFAAEEDITSAIRADAIGMGASKVSKHPEVRQALLGLQRELGARGGVVMDGRDIGTVVLPDAELKVYLDADVRVRALRRHSELVRRGESISLAAVQQALSLRDKQDMEREVAPLKAAHDAVRLDTTELTISQAIRTVIRWAVERGATLPS